MSTTTITPTSEVTPWGDGSYRIDCDRCGPVAEYRGGQFTAVEARRHSDWCNGR